MTNRLRTVLVLLSLLFLGGGYLGSQVASLQGQQSAFAHQMDQLWVRVLACLLFVGAMLLAFVGESATEDSGA